MSSKRAKKKKVKCGKRLKCGKIKNIIRRKRVTTKISNETCSETYSNRNKCSQNRYLGNVESWRCDIEEKKAPKLIDFAQIRKRYFEYLQTVVTKNCAFYRCKPSITTLENLSLDLEQEALLASLRAEIYIKSISKIINDIEKCTEKKQVHEEVQKLLPKALAKSKIKSSIREFHTQVSIVSNSEAQKHLPPNKDKTITPSVTDKLDQCHSDLNKSSHNCTKSNNSHESDGPDSSVSNSHKKNWCDEDKAKKVFTPSSISQNPSTLVNCQPSIDVTNIPIPDEQGICDKPCSLNTAEPVKVNPLLNSLNQLQKSVEQTLNASDKIIKQKAEEKERAYIAQILEGNDSLDEHSDSFSDNGNDSKENLYENSFMNRIEKMREIFGINELANDTKKPVYLRKTQLKKNNVNKKPTIWRHEKIIQQYKFATLSSEMSLARQAMNKRLFLQLFGDDSDDEHEIQYRSEEIFRASCTERISSWVVKHLMPYYNNRRIVGRSMFKNLGHYISDVIVDEIQYPDEWTVKYFVSKFFPTRKKYVCDADILSLQLD